MKKIFASLGVILLVAILGVAVVFAYGSYKDLELKKENEESNSQTTSETSNNENQSNQSQKNSQDQATTEENTNDEQQVTRDNMFDYAIAAVNEVGDADLLKFQEPEYNGSEWTINANNKSGAGANTIVVKDDGTVQIWNGPKTSMNHETKIEL